MWSDEKLIDVLYKTAALEDDQPERFKNTNRLDVAARTLGTAGMAFGKPRLNQVSRVLNVVKKNVREQELHKKVKAEDLPRPIGSQEKLAGLFLKPSDLADHRNLASALEGALSGSDQTKNFKKHANVDPVKLTTATVGAVAAGTTAYLKSQYTKDTKQPEPEQVQGNPGSGFKNAIAKARVDASNWAKENPMTAVLAASTGGAIAGWSGGAANAVGRLVKVLSNKPPII